ESNTDLEDAYFYGGVSPAVAFEIRVDGLRQLVQHHSDGQIPPVSVADVAFVTLMSCFEAFCRDNVAAVLNIVPALVRRLEEADRDVTISARELVDSAKPGQPFLLGFILAEKYEFTRAEDVNRTYTALLRTTPFSKKELQ